jgi:hypothetical protein
VFCSRDESIDHLFFACPIARMIWSVFQCSYNTHAQPMKMAELGNRLENFSGQESVTTKVSLAGVFCLIWKTCNRACFDNVPPSDPSDIIYLICHLLDYWCELQKPRIQEGLRQGNNLAKMLRQIFNRARGRAPLCQRIVNS